MRTIKGRLGVYFTILIIFPVLMSITLTYIKSNEIIEHKIKESIYNNIRQVEINVDNILENSKGVLNSLFLDNNLKTYLKENVDIDGYEDFKKLDYIMNVLFKSANLFANIDSIYVYDINDDILITSNRKAIKGSNFYKSHIYKESIENNRLMEWIPNIREIPPYTKPYDNLVTYVVPLYIYEEKQIVGYVFININENVLNKYLNRVQFGKQGHMMISNNEGQIISYKDKNLLGKQELYAFEKIGMGSHKRTNEDMKKAKGEIMLYSDESSVTSIRYYAFVPFTVVNREIRFLRNIIILACLLSIIFALFLSMAFMKDMCKPVNRLVAAMDQVTENPDLDYRIEDQREDEFGVLYMGFNKMVSEMQQLFSQMLAEQLEKKEAQLKLLHAEINPHFLYNTLNSIYCISKAYDVGEISELSYALSNFFRISLNDGKELISIERTLEHIDYYVRIQSVRYRKKFRIMTYMEKDLLNHNILQFLIQPLVENAIIHGMNNRSIGGTINITAYKLEGIIKFYVADDGIGITWEKLKRVQRTLLNTSLNDECEGMFALKNINHRIKLYYGLDYGIQIFSIEGSGTVVEILLPADKGG